MCLCKQVLVHEELLVQNTAHGSQSLHCLCGLKCHHSPPQKIRVLPAVGKDPESQRSEKIKVCMCWWWDTIWRMTFGVLRRHFRDETPD